MKAERIKPYLSCIHTLKLELAEAELLAGVDSSKRTRMPQIAHQLHDMGVKQLVINLGSQGVFSSQDRKGHFHNRRDSSLNLKTDGQEGLLAGLVHGHLQSANWQSSVEFGMVAAGISSNNEHAYLQRQGRQGTQPRSTRTAEKDADLGLYYD